MKYSKKAYKAELKSISQQLHYMDPANIAKDFPSKRERAAIVAVFQWLALNAVCVRSLKNGHYSPFVLLRKGKLDFDTTFNAVVLHSKALAQAEALLVDSKKK